MRTLEQNGHPDVHMSSKKQVCIAFYSASRNCPTSSILSGSTFPHAAINPKHCFSDSCTIVIEHAAHEEGYYNTLCLQLQASEASQGDSSMLFLEQPGPDAGEVSWYFIS